MDLTDYPNEVIRKAVLEQIGGCARFERAEDVLVALVHRQDDDAGVREFGSQSLDGLDAAHAGQLQVHDGDVGTEASEELERLFPGRRHRDDPHVRLEIQELRDRFPNDRMILDI